MINQDFNSLEPAWQQLVQAAIEVATIAYAPYSQYRVGAALQTVSGSIFTGCNVENAVLGETICAERTAVVKAVSAGQREFSVIAVATKNGGAPCGSCRQVMREFAPDIIVLISDFAGQVRITSLRELLPDSFGAEQL